MDEVLENIDENKPQEVPQTVKVLSIFAYIGNGLWATIFLVVLLWIAFAFNSFRLPGVRSSDTGIICAALLFVTALCALSIVGAAKMAKGKKSGFYLYAIPNGIWSLMLFFNLEPTNIVVSLVSISFISGFASQLKYLK